MNQFFDVSLSFDVNRLRINCTFLNVSWMSYERSCTAEFGFGKEGQCAHNDLLYALSSEDSITNASHIISVELPILLMKNDVLCFEITARDNRYSAKVERILTISSGRLHENNADLFILLLVPCYCPCAFYRLC